MSKVVEMKPKAKSKKAKTVKKAPSKRTLLTEIKKQYKERIAYEEKMTARINAKIEVFIDKNYPQLSDNKIWEFKDESLKEKTGYSRYRTHNIRMSFSNDENGEISQVYLVIHGYGLNDDGTVKGYHEAGMNIDGFLEQMKISDNQEWTPPQID